VLKQQRLRKALPGVVSGVSFLLLASVVYAATQGTIDFQGLARRNPQVGVNFTQPQCVAGGDASVCSVEVAGSGKVLNFNMTLNRAGDSQMVSFCLENVGGVNAVTGEMTALVPPGDGIIVAPPNNIDGLLITPFAEICTNGGRPLFFHVAWDANSLDGDSRISFSYQLNYAQEGHGGFSVIEVPPDRIPLALIPNAQGYYFHHIMAGAQQVEIIYQSVQDGDLNLSLCAANSNNGQTDWTMEFYIVNSTGFTWTNGRTQLQSPASGGRPNTRFTFTGAPLSHSTLRNNETATISLNMRSQLGQADAGGSATILVFYTVQGTERTTTINFTYVPRGDPACPL
jgi:hypothetical protein